MEITPPSLLRAVEPLGLYFRPGRNDHTALLQALAIEGPGFTGAVLDASLAARHGDLLADLKQTSDESGARPDDDGARNRGRMGAQGAADTSLGGDHDAHP